MNKSFQERCDEVMYYSLLGLVFVLPISLSLITLFSLATIATLIVKRVFVLFSDFRLHPEYSWWRKLKHIVGLILPKKNFLTVPLICFILANLLSVMFSEYPAVSWKAFFRKFLEGYVIFVAFVEVFNTRHRLFQLLWVSIASMVVVGLDGIYQLFAGKDFLRSHASTGGGRLTASFKSPNDFGTYLIVVTTAVSAFLLGFLPHKKKGEKPLFDLAKHWPILIAIVAIFMLVAFNLTFTFSRGAWAGFFVGIVALFVCSRRGFALPILLIALFLGIATPLMVHVRNVSFVSDDHHHEINQSFFQGNIVEKMAKRLKEFGGMGRLGIWEDGLNVIKHKPVFGTGLNTYMKSVEKYNEEWVDNYAHNCYLQMTAELGFVGLLTFLWLCGSLLLYCWRHLHVLDDSLMKYTALGVSCGLLAYLFHCFLDTALYSAQLSMFMWVLFGVLVSIFVMHEHKIEAVPSGLVVFHDAHQHNINRIKYVGVRGALLMTSLAVTCLIIEGLFLLFKGPMPHLVQIAQQEQKHLFRPNQVIHSKSSIEGEFEYEATINEFGYRSPSFDPNNDEEFRLFAIGDSFTFGVGAEDDETIPYLMEKHLRNSKVRVVNAGTGHASPITHYKNLKDIHSKYRPDAVMLLLDLTDLWDDWNWGRHAVKDENGNVVTFDLTYIDGEQQVWRVLASKSHFARWIDRKVLHSWQKMRILGLKKYVQHLATGERAKALIIKATDEVSDKARLAYDGLLMMRGKKEETLISRRWRTTSQYILNMRSLLGEDNIPLMLVMYPHGIYVGDDQWGKGRLTWGFEANKTYTDYFAFELVEKFAKDNDIPFINTLPHFLKADPQTKYFFDWDGHLTPEGNKIVSDAIINHAEFKQFLDEAKKEKWGSLNN